MRLAAACLAVLLTMSGAVMAQTTTPTPAPGPGKVATPTATAPAAATPPAATAAASATGKTMTPAASAADEAAAKQKCGSDTVVWGSPSTKVYHTADSRYYGKTKKGSFMCLKDATAAGYHAPKNTAHAKKPAKSAS